MIMQAYAGFIASRLQYLLFLVNVKGATKICYMALKTMRWLLLMQRFNLQLVDYSYSPKIIWLCGEVQAQQGLYSGPLTSEHWVESPSPPLVTSITTWRAVGAGGAFAATLLCSALRHPARLHRPF